MVHRWPALRESLIQLEKKRDEGDPDILINERIEHGKLLNDLMVKEFGDISESMKDMQELGVITYEHLWTIFQPGSLVYSKQDNQDRALRLQSSKYGTDRNQAPCLWLTCIYIDFDGNHFGTQKLNVQISKFEGTRPINTLTGYPMEFHEQADEMRAKLIERGAKVESLSGTSYCSYNGVGWHLSQYGDKEQTSVSGRVVSDKDANHHTVRWPLTITLLLGH